jgi:hypothetical protein
MGKKKAEKKDKGEYGIKREEITTGDENKKKEKIARINIRKCGRGTISFLEGSGETMVFSPCNST